MVDGFTPARFAISPYPIRGSSSSVTVRTLQRPVARSAASVSRTPTLHLLNLDRPACLPRTRQCARHTRKQLLISKNFPWCCRVPADFQAAGKDSATRGSMRSDPSSPGGTDIDSARHRCAAAPPSRRVPHRPALGEVTLGTCSRTVVRSASRVQARSDRSRYRRDARRCGSVIVGNRAIRSVLLVDVIRVIRPDRVCPTRTPGLRE